MGIHGLWKLLEPAGKDITLESLENKVLAIDVSLWLHQAQQGTSHVGEGGNVPNAHLLTLFHRISKLLFYRIKPVFVFDGIAPELKKKTINARKQRKQVASDRAKEMRQQLLLSLAKSGAINAVLKAEATKTVAEPKKSNVPQGLEEDLYKLPPLPANSLSTDEQHSSSEDSWGSNEDGNLMSYYEVEECINKPKVVGTKGKVEGGWKKWNTWVDPHEVDVQNKEFKSLPVEVRREILTDLKEARKESSWGRLHKMPKDLGSFSSFQVSRLLHRRKVQEVLEGVEEELAKTEMKVASLGELEAILTEKGVNIESGLGQISQRIASDENKGFILLSGLKDQNKDKEADDKKNTNLSQLRSIKEEPVDTEITIDSEEDILKTPLDKVKQDKLDEEREETKKWLEGKQKMHERLNEKIYEPTLIESKILNENSKVKDFVKITMETPDFGSDANEGGIFENVSNAWNDGSSQEEELSQGEIMAMIKNQPVSSTTEIDINDTETLNKTDIQSTNCQDVMRLIKDQPVSSIIEIDIDGAETLTKTKKVIQSILNSNNRKNEDLENDSVDFVEEVIRIQETENAGLTQEQIIAMIHNESTKLGTGNEIKGCSGSRNSESDESDLLEVEEFNEEVETDDKVSTTEVKESCQKVNPVGHLDPEGKPHKNKDLEVVIKLDIKSDDSDDIFADVFQSQEKSPENNIESLPQKSFFEDHKSIGVLNEEHQIKENICVESIESDNVTCIAEDVVETPVSGNELKEQENDEEALIDLGKRERQLEAEMEVLTEEQRHRLTLEMRKREREANAGVTEKARLESQELLGLFGVPWVVAPFEAEAQCAFLESAVPKTSKSPSTSSFCRFLAEGTVTEDSDVWAFGASNVYRHVFDRRRTRVRIYSKEEIQKRLGLNRIRVVQLALLTGSDYTVGLPGVGTVTALEILAAFPGEKDPHASSSSESEVEDVLSGLQHFADWWKRVEMNEENGTPIGHSYFDPLPAVSKTLRRRLCVCWKAAGLKQLGSSFLPSGFPSRAVVQAYLRPSVDECRDTFTWLKPDEAALRSYAELHFGWTRERIDSVLRPLFARLKLSDNVDRKQTSLHSYFSHISTNSMPIDLECTNIGIRTRKALEKIAGKCEELSSSPSKRIKKGTCIEDNETDNAQGKNDKKGKQRYANQCNKAGSSISAIKASSNISSKATKKTASVMNKLNITDIPIKETGFASSLYSNDKIPQREKDCATALQSKMKAIEVLRKSSMGGSNRAGRNLSKNNKKFKRAEVPLSESSDSD